MTAVAKQSLASSKVFTKHKHTKAISEAVKRCFFFPKSPSKLFLGSKKNIKLELIFVVSGQIKNKPEGEVMRPQVVDE